MKKIFLSIFLCGMFLFGTTLAACDTTNALKDDVAPDPENLHCPAPADPYSLEDPYKEAGNEVYLKNECLHRLSELVRACEEEKESYVKGKVDDYEEDKATKLKNIDENERKAFETEFEKLGKSDFDDLTKSDFPKETYFVDQSDLSNLNEERALIQTGYDELEATQDSEIKKDIRINIAERILKHEQNLASTYITGPNKYKEETDKYPTTLEEKYDALETALREVRQTPSVDKEAVTQELSKNIKALEKKIDAITQSLFIHGSNGFNVSGLLSTRSNGDIKSKEGDLRVIKSYEEEQFCGNLKNRDLEPDQWEKICNSNIIDKVIRLASQVIGTVGVILLLIASVMLITARGDEGQTEKAKNMIMYTLGGLLIFFLSFVIVQFIIDLLVW